MSLRKLIPLAMIFGLMLPAGAAFGRGPLAVRTPQVLAAAATVPSMYAPSGVAAGPHGIIYVADSGNNRVLKLSPAGRLLAQWSVPLLSPDAHYFHVFPGLPAGQLPAESITVDSTGNVYVTAVPRSSIMKLSPQGHLLAEWHVASNIVAAGRGVVYDVTAGKTTNQIEKRSLTGALLTAWSDFSPDGRHAAGVGGLAVAPSGDIYVDLSVTITPDPSACYRSCPDSVNSYIERLSPQGKQLASWQWSGCTEWDESCGATPAPMTAAPDGSVLIADRINNKVLHYSSGGTQLDAWAIPGDNPGAATRVMGMATYGQSGIVLSDASGGRIEVLTMEGSLLADWGGGSGRGQFFCPQAVAVARDGTVFIRDSGNNRVVKLSAGGTPIGGWSLGPASPSDPACGSDSTIAVDAQGRVYLLPPNQRTHVFIYSGTGHLLKTIDLGRIIGFAVAVGGSGNIFVSGNDFNVSNSFHRLFKFSPAGKLLVRWPTTRPQESPVPLYNAIAVDRAGTIYLSEGTGARIDKLSPSFHSLGRWEGFAFPRAVTTDRRGNVYVADTGDNFVPPSTKRQGVVKLSSSGAHIGGWWSKGSNPGQVHDPAGVAVDPTGHWLYISDTGNNRIQRVPLT